MRVLVTGARGFVGRLLLPRLTRRFPHLELLSEIADIADEAAVNAAIAQGRPDICLHLAAISAIGAAEHDPNRAWNVNLGGTRHLAEAMLRHTPDSTLIFASTAEIYGMTFASNVALNESATLAPGNTYAATKAAADLALGVYARKGLRTIRMRPFNHTGPGQTEAFVTSAFAAQLARIALGRQPPYVHVGNLDAERDFLDARDVCDAYLDAVERTATLKPGTIINICSGTPRSIRSILDDLLEISGVSATIVQDPARMRPSDIPKALGDGSRAADLLAWSPKIPWRTTLEDVFHDALARENLAYGMSSVDREGD